MKSSIVTRLAALEKRGATKPELKQITFERAFHTAAVAIVTHHAGDWREWEEPVEALARGLQVSLQQAKDEMAATTPAGHLFKAVDKVFAARGYRFLEADETNVWAEIKGPFAVLLAEVPEELRDALRVSWFLWAH